jgi:hypothetical protein
MVASTATTASGPFSDVRPVVVKPDFRLIAIRKNKVRSQKDKPPNREEDEKNLWGSVKRQSESNLGDTKEGNPSSNPLMQEKFKGNLESFLSFFSSMYHTAPNRLNHYQGI